MNLTILFDLINQNYWSPNLNLKIDEFLKKKKKID